MDELDRTYRNLQKKMRHDLFDIFAEDCIIHNNHSISKNNIFDTFKVWCNHNNIYVSYALKQELFKAMNKKFYTETKTEWKGIDVKDSSVIKSQPQIEHDPIKLTNSCMIMIKYIFLELCENQLIIHKEIQKEISKQEQDKNKLKWITYISDNIDKIKKIIQQKMKHKFIFYKNRIVYDLFNNLDNLLQSNDILDYLSLFDIQLHEIKENDIIPLILTIFEKYHKEYTCKFVNFETIINGELKKGRKIIWTNNSEDVNCIPMIQRHIKNEIINNYVIDDKKVNNILNNLSSILLINFRHKCSLPSQSSEMDFNEVEQYYYTEKYS
jgi:hypothetical protein